MAATPRPFTILGPSASGGFVIPNAGKATGLQLYNTADQTTNYERLEMLFASNVAYLSTTTGGTATGRNLVISAQTSNGAASFGRIFLSGNATYPVLSVGLYSTRTGSGTVSAPAAGTAFLFGGGLVNTATSGTVVCMGITPTYNQTSGTAANTDLLINRTETAVGSGTQYLIQAQTGGADRFRVTTGGRGYFATSVSAGSTGATASLTVGGNIAVPAWGTNGIAGRFEAATHTDTSTAASGTAASAVFTSFAQPTLAATNASVTTTDAATVYIANAPAAGTNQTIPNAWSLWVAAGACRFDGAVLVRAALRTQRQVLARTTNAAEIDSNSFYVATNEGATSKVERTLPSAAAGYEYTFVVQDSDGIRIIAAAGDTIRVAGSVSSAGGYAENTTIGSTITLVAINATEWIATSVNGTWTLA
jgi:hypothetical protein